MTARKPSAYAPNVDAISRGFSATLLAWPDPPTAPKIHGCAMLIVPLGEVAPYPLLHVMVEEEGPSRFSGIVSGPGGPAAGLVGADCGTHASLGALSLRAKEIGEAHLAATEPPLPDVEGA